jgi:hypothetical protein
MLLKIFLDAKLSYLDQSLAIRLALGEASLLIFTNLELNLQSISL